MRVASRATPTYELVIGTPNVAERLRRPSLTNQVLPTVDVPRLEAAVREILAAIGEDPNRDGLRDTPRRHAKHWREFIEYAPGSMDTAFAAEGTDQMVVVGGIRVWSLCEHHLLPFWCDVAIGYVPTDKVLGLSKLGRIAHYYAHRLQLQEQLVAQVAQHVKDATGSENVAVVAQGEHSCMTMRGIKTPATMSSTKLFGVFRQIAARDEFYTLAGIRR